MFTKQEIEWPVKFFWGFFQVKYTVDSLIVYKYLILSFSCFALYQIVGI